MSSSRYAIIVAGGLGVRMGAKIPKQFLCLNGLPILMHTLNVFQSLDPAPSIYLVLPKAEQSGWQQLCQEHSFTIPHSLVAGGETRFQSVKNGLDAIEGKGIVAIHDGVRPLVTAQLIERCYAQAQAHGNAVPAVQPVETIRLGSITHSKLIKRDECWLVQTPQVFDVETIKKCYKTPWKAIFTDDASVAEHHGETIRMVQGERDNIKITTSTDIAVAEAILMNRKD